MDNSLKRKHPREGLTPPRKGKTKTFLIGKELKINDLLRTAAERTSEPPTKTRIKTPGERRVKPLARFSTLSVARILGSGRAERLRSSCRRRSRWILPNLSS